MQAQPGRSQRPPRQREPLPPLFEHVRRPQVFLPIAVVVAMMAFAFGVQPNSGAPAANPDTPVVIVSETPSPTPTPAETPSPDPTATGDVPEPTGTVTDDVAGARSTPEPSATPEEDYSRSATECGPIQETATPISVEQSISGIAIRATRATAYPIEYFRCILMATGGGEAVSLASAISKAQRSGATHAVLVDLWITNSGRDFGQVNLKSSSLAAAGQQFAPLATLGGRAEVVVSSGQGREVTLVLTITNDIGPTTGPMTLSVDAPLIGGSAQQGKYQLFLPTP